MTRYVYAEVFYNLEPDTAAGFVDRFIKFFPYPIKKIIIDNGFEWADRCVGGVKDKASGSHPVDIVCKKSGIKQVLTRIRRPQTNGMVARFNRSAIALKESIAGSRGRNAFHTYVERNAFIRNFVEAYNRTALRCLNYRNPSSLLFVNLPKYNTQAKIQKKHSCHALHEKRAFSRENRSHLARK